MHGFGGHRRARDERTQTAACDTAHKCRRRNLPRGRRQLPRGSSSREGRSLLPGRCQHAQPEGREPNVAAPQPARGRVGLHFLGYPLHYQHSSRLGGSSARWAVGVLPGAGEVVRGRCGSGHPVSGCRPMAVILLRARRARPSRRRVRQPWWERRSRRTRRCTSRSARVWMGFHLWRSTGHLAQKKASAGLRPSAILTGTSSRSLSSTMSLKETGMREGFMTNRPGV